jgi:hypothetical protein
MPRLEPRVSEHEAKRILIERIVPRLRAEETSLQLLANIDKILHWEPRPHRGPSHISRNLARRGTLGYGNPASPTARTNSPTLSIATHGPLLGNLHWLQIKALAFPI